MSFNFIFIQILRFLVLFIFLFQNQNLESFQGIWLPAFGAGQAGLGGAFYAPNGSPLDLEENPAMLTRLKGSTFQFALAMNKASIGYRDRYWDPTTNITYSNHSKFSPIAPLPALGYANKQGNFAYGIAGYVQGGGGADFSGLTRTLPKPEPELDESRKKDYYSLNPSQLAKEELHARFFFLKITPSFAYSLGSFSIGLGLDVVYSKMSLQRENRSYLGNFLLPGGFSHESNPSLSSGAKIGISYRITNSITIATSYSTKNRMYLDGKLKSDSYLPIYSSEVSVSRYMQWPERFVWGIEFKQETYRLVADLTYTLWSRAFTNFDFHLSQPVQLTPLQTRSSILRMNFDWKDQIALTAGAERYIKDWILRLGYSYAPNPQSTQTLNPVMGTTMNHHFFSGIGYKWKNEEDRIVQFDVAFQYSPPRTMKGERLSDWWIGHAIESEPIRPTFFEYEKTSSVFAIYFGILYGY